MRIALRPRGFAVPAVLAGLVLALSIPLRGGPTEVRSGDEVQIYESIIADANSRVTTGLLTGVRYVKDNRLLPRGFDKATADPPRQVARDASWPCTGGRSYT